MSNYDGHDVHHSTLAVVTGALGIAGGAAGVLDHLWGWLALPIGGFLTAAGGLIANAIWRRYAPVRWRVAVESAPPPAPLQPPRAKADSHHYPRSH